MTDSGASRAAADGFDSITLRSPDGSTEAEFVPAANMVCCSLRYDGAEYLDEGRGLASYAERGKTMGIPLLYPWANRLAGFAYDAAGKHVVVPQTPAVPVDPAGLPIHGALPGLMRWQAEHSGPGALAATLSWDEPELLELFPFAHEVGFEARVDRGMLAITTTVQATSDDAVPVSFGYHPYLRLPGTSRDTWRVTLGAFRRLVLDARMIPTGEREPAEPRAFQLQERSLDDAFDALAVPAEFTATDGAATMAVEFVDGFAYAQVYAPLGKDFICFEPMTAPTNALNSGDGLRILAPGERHRATFTISVLPAR